MLPLSSLILYILTLGTVVFAWILANGLVKTWRFHFLSAYLGYVAAINIVWFLNLIVTELSVDVLKNIPPSDREAIFILFGLGAFPLLAVAFHFLLSFVGGILDERMSGFVLIGHSLLWVLIFGIFLVRIQFILGHRQDPVSLPLQMGLTTVALLIPVAAQSYLVFRTSRRKRSEGTHGLALFACVSIISYLGFAAVMIFIQPRSPFRWAAPAGLFLFNIAPILTLRRVLSRFGRPFTPDTFADPRMDEFRAHFQLSPREREILDHLLKGKSNREIERDLFISSHTVRNHVYNIYRKMDISNRLQLMNRLKTWLESGPPR